MSQHIIYSKIEGQEVEVQMGWDSPMNWYYLVISPIFDDGEHGDPIYSNLNEINPATNSLKYYVDVCSQNGVDVSLAMIEGIEEDRRLGRMNNRVEY